MKKPNQSLLYLWMDPKLKRRFKAKCASIGISMKGAVLSFIESEVKRSR